MACPFRTLGLSCTAAGILTGAFVGHAQELKAPPGKESNWAQTVPGKGRNTILRLSGHLAPRFDEAWGPDDIVLKP